MHGFRVKRVPGMHVLTETNAKTTAFLQQPDFTTYRGIAAELAPCGSPTRHILLGVIVTDVSGPLRTLIVEYGGWYGSCVRFFSIRGASWGQDLLRAEGCRQLFDVQVQTPRRGQELILQLAEIRARR